MAKEEGIIFMVDTRPTWEEAIRIHLGCCVASASERCTESESEIIRAARLLDMLLAERNGATAGTIINHADDSDDIIEKRIALKAQMKAVNKAGVQLVCFDCKREVRLMYMYKCRDCGLYFCPACATKHFEQKDLLSLLWAVAAQDGRGPMQPGVPEIVHDIFKRRGLSVHDLYEWKSKQEIGE